LDIFEIFTKRKSTRAYHNSPVSEEDLFKVLNAGRLAPSAGNVQPWHFIVVKNRETLNRIAKGCRYGKFLLESPIVIIACGNKKTSPRWYTIDTSLALEHIVLAATAIGLGTCWIGMFNQENIRELTGLPKDFEIVALLALGHPRKKTDVWAKILHVLRPRKRLNDITSLESYEKKL
jgi:nitroreductase